MKIAEFLCKGCGHVIMQSIVDPKNVDEYSSNLYITHVDPMTMHCAKCSVKLKYEVGINNET